MTSETGIAPAADAPAPRMPVRSSRKCRWRRCSPAGAGDPEGPLHPAGCAGGHPRRVRGTAGPAAVPDPPAEPGHPRHPGRRDHPAVRGLHPGHARNALRAGRRYLVMAAIWPRSSRACCCRARPARTALEDDPRADLVRRLQEYERYKQAAEDLDTLPRRDRATPRWSPPTPDRAAVRLPPPVEMKEMLLALHDVLKRASCSPSTRSSATR